MVRNFWRLRGIAWFRVMYVYVDHASHLADRLFESSGVSIKIYKELLSEDVPYRIIFCKVRKKDISRFEEALSKLENKILLYGYSGYDEVCDKLQKIMDRGFTTEENRDNMNLQHVVGQ